MNICTLSASDKITISFLLLLCFFLFVFCCCCFFIIFYYVLIFFFFQTEDDQDSDVEEVTTNVEEKVECLVSFTMDKLASFEARLDRMESRAPPPIPHLASIFAGPSGTSTPKPSAFQAPKKLNDVCDSELRENLRGIQVPSPPDRKELLTDPQLRYVLWYRQTKGPVTGMPFLFHLLF